MYLKNKYVNETVVFKTIRSILREEHAYQNKHCLLFAYKILNFTHKCVISKSLYKTTRIRKNRKCLDIFM